MNNTVYLFAAFGVAWAIVFLYIYRLFISVNTLCGRVEKMEKKLSEYSTANGGAL